MMVLLQHNLPSECLKSLGPKDQPSGSSQGQPMDLPSLHRGDDDESTLWNEARTAIPPMNSQDKSSESYAKIPPVLHLGEGLVSLPWPREKQMLIKCLQALGHK